MESITIPSIWFQEIPKIELHLHLEGAVPLAAMWELIHKHGGDPYLSDLESLRKRFGYRNFHDFIQTWVWKNQFLKDYDDFTFIAEEVARDLFRQNVLYAEIFFSPPDFRSRGLKTERLAESIRRGLSRVPGIRIGLIVDLVRDFGPDLAMETLRETCELGNLGILGIGLGGSESEFPPAPFKAVFETARKKGLRTTVHAGEAAGPERIWEAIRELKPDRIGHGTHAADDESLIDYLADCRLPLELCPISNLKTGAVPAYDRHPVAQFYRKNVPVSINTDDPMMFGNSLAEEFERLHEVFGLGKSDIFKLIAGAVEASWMRDEEKIPMRDKFKVHPAFR